MADGLTGRRRFDARSGLAPVVMGRMVAESDARGVGAALEVLRLRGRLATARQNEGRLEAAIADERARANAIGRDLDTWQGHARVLERALADLRAERDGLAGIKLERDDAIRGVHELMRERDAALNERDAARDEVQRVRELHGDAILDRNRALERATRAERFAVFACALVAANADKAGTPANADTLHAVDVARAAEAWATRWRSFIPSSARIELYRDLWALDAPAGGTRP